MAIMPEPVARLPFWQSALGRIIRWFVFLPLCFAMVAILQALPPLVVALLKNIKFYSNFLSVCIAVAVISGLGTAIIMWVLAIITSIWLCCCKIAPRGKPAAIVFGTSFCIFQLCYLITYSGGGGWVFWIYQAIFSAIVLFGTVAACKDQN